MRWPENATPAEAARSAHLACRHCGGLHENADKAEMNARGVYVAPGQWVKEGDILGQPLLATFEERENLIHPASRAADLPGDLAIVIAALGEVADLCHEVDGPLLAPSDVLDEAHHQAFRFGDVDDDGRDLGLSQHAECFQPSLAAHQVIVGGVASLPAAHGERTFETDRRDIVHDLMVLTAIAGTWIENVDHIDRYHFDGLCA
jgi:hypothetical protein